MSADFASPGNVRGARSMTQCVKHKQWFCRAALRGKQTAGLAQFGDKLGYACSNASKNSTSNLLGLDCAHNNYYMRGAILSNIDLSIIIDNRVLQIIDYYHP